MRLVPTASIAFALAGSLVATAALANDPAPAPATKLGETLELRTDGPFTKPTFHVIRSQADLARVFKGQPPRTDIDFSAGPVVLYASRPGGTMPLIVDCVPFHGRTDVRIKKIPAGLLSSQLTGQGAGAPYHMVQIAAPANSNFRPSVAQRSKLQGTLRTDAKGAHFEQVHRFTGRIPVVIRAVNGNTLTVSPAKATYVRGEIDASWISRVRGSVDLAPDVDAIVAVPEGETMTLPGSFRMHPTDAELITRLQSATSLRDKVMQLEGDLYATIPYRNQAFEIHTIDPMRAGKSPVIVGKADDAATVASIMGTVFPVKPIAEATDTGLAGGAPLVEDSRTARQTGSVIGDEGPTVIGDEGPTMIGDEGETVIGDEVEPVSVDEDAQADEVGPLVKTETAIGDEGDEPTAQADETGPSLVNVVTQVTDEMDAVGKPDTTAEDSEELTVAGGEETAIGDEAGPEIEQSTALAKTETGTAIGDEGEEPVVVSDGPAEEQSTALVKTETDPVIGDEGDDPVIGDEGPEIEQSTALAKTETGTAIGDEGEEPVVVSDGPAEEQSTALVKTETETAIGDEAVIVDEELTIGDETVVTTIGDEGDAQDQESEDVVTVTTTMQDQEQNQEPEEIFPWKGTVTVSELNVREAPQANANGLLVFFQNTEVEVVGRADNGWLIVKVPQLQGYVSKSLINFPNGRGKKGGPATINLSFVNLRSQPSSRSIVKVMLRQDFPLTVRRTGHRGNWLRVTSAGEFQAFVHGCYVNKVGE